MFMTLRAMTRELGASIAILSPERKSLYSSSEYCLRRIHVLHQELQATRRCGQLRRAGSQLGESRMQSPRPPALTAVLGTTRQLHLRAAHCGVLAETHPTEVAR